MKNKYFIILLLLVVFLINNSLFVNKEKRELFLYKKSVALTINFKELRTSFKQLRDKLSNSLNFIEEIKEFKANILFSLFSQTIEDYALLTHNGQKITRINNYYFSSSQLQRIRKNKNIILEYLEDVKEELSKRDIDFYILYIPEKNELYKNELPNEIRYTQRNFNQIQPIANELLSETSVQIINTTSTLEGLKEDYRLFFEYDHHLKRYASFVIAQIISNKINKTHNEIKIDPNKLIKSEKYKIGLLKLLLLNEQMEENNYSYEGYQKNEAVPDTDYQMPYRPFTINGKEHLPKAIIYHNSISYDLSYYMKNIFSETYIF